MSDPRNVAHDKKVTQEKQKDSRPAPKSRGTTGRKKKSPGEATDQQPEAAAVSSSGDVAKERQAPGDLEKSVAILSKLKEMEFHSRANIETLAELTLTIEEELKQREFSDAIGAVYSAQDAFHSKIVALIEAYEAKCESLKPSA